MAKATTKVKVETKAYTILQEGWLNGQHRRKNSTVELTDAEAKYLVLSGHVALRGDDEKASAKAAKLAGDRLAEDIAAGKKLEAGLSTAAAVTEAKLINEVAPKQKN